MQYYWETMLQASRIVLHDKTSSDITSVQYKVISYITLETINWHHVINLFILIYGRLWWISIASIMDRWLTSKQYCTEPGPMGKVSKAQASVLHQQQDSTLLQTQVFAISRLHDNCISVMWQECSKKHMSCVPY